MISQCLIPDHIFTILLFKQKITVISLVIMLQCASTPLQAGTFSRGVVTMRCDFSTTTSAHISLLVSGSAQTCFNDQASMVIFQQLIYFSQVVHVNYIIFMIPNFSCLQLLENHIKNEIIENCQLVHALPSCDENNLASSEPRKSASIACGASVFEVCMKVPTWASQVPLFLALLSTKFWCNSLAQVERHSN